VEVVGARAGLGELVAGDLAAVTTIIGAMPCL
jgi:hypothetical protein